MYDARSAAGGMTTLRDCGRGVAAASGAGLRNAITGARGGALGVCGAGCTGDGAGRARDGGRGAMRGEGGTNGTSSTVSSSGISPGSFNSENGT